MATRVPNSRPFARYLLRLVFSWWRSRVRPDGRLICGPMRFLALWSLKRAPSLLRIREMRRVCIGPSDAIIRKTLPIFGGGCRLEGGYDGARKRFWALPAYQNWAARPNSRSKSIRRFFMKSANSTKVSAWSLPSIPSLVSQIGSVASSRRPPFCLIFPSMCLDEL